MLLKQTKKTKNSIEIIELFYYHLLTTMNWLVTIQREHSTFMCSTLVCIQTEFNPQCLLIKRRIRRH